MRPSEATPKKTQLFIRILTWVLLLALAIWAAFGMKIPDTITTVIRVESARWESWFQSQPVIFVGAFSALHIFISFFSLPGCILLNLFAGATFGFGLGSAIVYPVTLTSASLGFWVGRKFREAAWLRKAIVHSRVPADTLRRELSEHGFVHITALRLNPFVPFGLINLLLGMGPVRYWTYLSGTALGIFFDVFLLNAAGAQIRRTGEVGKLEGGPLFWIFLGVLAVVILAKWLRRRQASVPPLA